MQEQGKVEEFYTLIVGHYDCGGYFDVKECLGIYKTKKDASMDVENYVKQLRDKQLKKMYVTSDDCYKLRKYIESISLLFEDAYNVDLIVNLQKLKETKEKELIDLQNKLFIKQKEKFDKETTNILDQIFKDLEQESEACFNSYEFKLYSSPLKTYN